MSRHICRWILVGVAVATGFLAATASEYCVVCSGPEAHYRCLTNDGREGVGADQRVWLQCIEQLAKGGGHESCSIDRAMTAPCSGITKTIDASNVGEQQASPVASEAPKDSVQPGPSVPANGGEPVAQPPPGKDAGVAPEPAEPAAPGVMEKSKESLDKAGSAIGDAAKKSWDCMSSLFKKC